MNLVFTLVICILASFLFTVLAKRLNASIVIGLIIAGIVIGSPHIKEIVLGANTELVLNLGDVGLVVLMFLAGIEVSWSMLYKEKKNAAVIATFAAITPIVFGYLVFLLMGFPLLTSLTIGICMGITAEATKARVLLELKKLKTKIGSLMMGAGIIDDIIGMCLFVLVGYCFTKTFSSKEFAILLAAIFAFFIGIATHKFIGREDHRVSRVEQLLLFFVIPFFFIAMGIHFSLQSLSLNPWIFIIVIMVAILGKICGALFTRPFTKLRFRQLYLIGWGMNSRGAVELAIAFTAFKVGLLNTEIYSSLVAMALVTTLIFPLFVKRMIKKEPGIMG